MDAWGLGIFAVSLVVWLITRKKQPDIEKFSLLTMGFGLGLAVGAWIAYFMIYPLFS